MPQTPGDGGGAGALRSRLKSKVRAWATLDERIKEIREWLGLPIAERGEQPEGLENLQEWREQRRELSSDVFTILRARPRLADEASKWGFTHEDFDIEDYVSAGDRERGGDEAPPGGGGGGDDGGDGTSGGGQDGSGGSGGGGGGGNDGQTLAQTRDNKLLGKLGKEFTLRRGPKGTYVAVYTYNINGETVRIGLRLGKTAEDLRRYGLKPEQARDLTAEQMKRIKNIGRADQLTQHMRRGDTSVFKALIRDLELQYPKSWAGAMLRNDEVMSKIIAQRMFGWDRDTFESQMKDTKWWRKTEPYRREFLTNQSPEQQKNAINRTLETVVNRLEDYFGVKWMEHVKGGMNQARNWATKIASGMWGDPSMGFQYWEDKIFDRAAKIENTPAWVNNQQEQNQYTNTVEDWRERVRSESMAYLGQSNGKPVLDDATLDAWATGLASTQRSESDWSEFLRNQMARIHPYFDKNVAFTEQASPYKALYEGIMRNTTTWDNPLLRSFNARNPDGTSTGEAMSLYDFEQFLRDDEKNPSAWQEGTQLWDEGIDFVTQLEQTFTGQR